MPGTKKRELTTPDLVLLSLLAERPMHGYQANLELERREVRDWAGISRPQVYYSLKKLQERGHVRVVGDSDPALGAVLIGLVLCSLRLARAAGAQP